MRRTLQASSNLFVGQPAPRLPHVSRLPSRQENYPRPVTIDPGSGPTLPEKLFHYTDEAGVLGIVQRMRFWATGVDFLNDTTEHRLADAHARYFARTASPAVRAALDKYLEDLDRQAELNIWPRRRYVVSFSESDDLLSQWRAYGKYALGFRAAPLANIDPGWRLVSCIYDEDHQLRLVGEAIESAFRLAETAGIETLDERAGVIASSLADLAPRLKHRTFSEEREWRLVNVAGSLPTPFFRPGRRSLMPYSEIDLEPALKANDLMLSDLIVGPSTHQDLMLRGAVSLMLAGGKQAPIGSVRASFIPLV